MVTVPALLSSVLPPLSYATLALLLSVPNED